MFWELPAHVILNQALAAIFYIYYFILSDRYLETTWPKVLLTVQLQLYSLYVVSGLHEGVKKRMKNELHCPEKVIYNGSIHINTRKSYLVNCFCDLKKMLAL